MGLGGATWAGTQVVACSSSLLVPGLPVEDMFLYPHPLVFVGFFLALTMVTILF